MPNHRREPGVPVTERHATAMENCQKSVPISLPVLVRFLERLNRELGLKPDSSFVRFVTDQEMARLNREFRHQKKTTDVLSFPSEPRTRPADLRRRTRALDGVFLGDIAISPRVARRNAKTFGRSMTEEICILLLHGVLHLLGYDHETDRGEMERVEAKLRIRLGLS